MAFTVGVCSIGDCERVGRIRRGWCDMHYSRWQRRGVPTAARRTVAERLMRRASVVQRVDGFDECWEWTGTRSGGYGMVQVGGRAHPAHRMALIHLGGIAVSDDHEVDHLCRNRACIRPSHLEAVTHRENTVRGVSMVAVNAAKVECLRGHSLLSDGDVYISTSGSRDCRACRRIRRSRKAA